MARNNKKFGTFEGVFTPSILTILGVILYLRLGWVVGSVGLWGAVVIILLSHIATITTGLSLSSLTTNVRIGHGGFYSLLSKSLGLEVAGAIGVPLYVSQALGAALYIIGFTELFTNLLPQYDDKTVATVVLFILLVISYLSAKLAMKVQYLIMAVIGLSLFAMFAVIEPSESNNMVWRYDKVSFWAVFAIFFPAVTGIGSGAAMSGDLANPKRSLPLGILTAVGVGLVVYIGTAFWYAYIGETDELVSNYFIAKDKAFMGWAVVAGIMGATISSALGTLVSAPRILMAVAQDRAVPFTSVFAKASKRGEPRVAILFTAVIIQAAILLGSLDIIAALLTMFFLITYGMINMAVFIEKGIGIPSFRPSFNIPLIVPIIGALWCFAVMFLIEWIFAAIALLAITVLYVLLVRRGLLSPAGDVRHGLLNSLAELAVQSAAKMPQGGKSWKPNLMIPIEEPTNWAHIMGFIRDIVFPSGTLRLFSVNVVSQGARAKLNQFLENIFKKKDREKEEEKPATNGDDAAQLRRDLSDLSTVVEMDNIFTANTVVDSVNFLEGISIVTQVMKGMFFPPNTMFLTMSSDTSKDKNLREMMAIAVREDMGLMVLGGSRKIDKEKTGINLWLRRGSPNRNLAILTALQIARNWGSEIRLISTVESSDEIQLTHNVLKRIIEQGRMPADTKSQVILGNYYDIIKKAPPAALNLFGLPVTLDTNLMHAHNQSIESPCLFLKDSGLESALA